ncbi:hypothetical protein D9C73_014522 [Collichthys lucidus]|uniref:Uncharacterized protein n=1 Tax=Collichthys lucidus TaxID=240159 RepID=A0A4U5UW16_COLLU|nr:hypothetical protein D9C73_014522 [Collichthys lucidus]
MSVSQITPTLFLSGADAPHNAALLSQKGITLIAMPRSATLAPPTRAGSVFGFQSPTCPAPACGRPLRPRAEQGDSSPGHAWVRTAALRPLNAGFWEQQLAAVREAAVREEHRQGGSRGDAADPRLVRSVQQPPPPPRANWMALVPRSPLMTRTSVTSQPQVMMPASRRRRGTKSSSIRA